MNPTDPLEIPEDVKAHYVSARATSLDYDV